VRGRWKLAARAAAAGAAIAICWLPAGLAPLAPLAFLLALRGLRAVGNDREALIFGGVYGVSRYAVASHFLLALLRYSPLAIVFYLLAMLFILPFGLLEGWGSLRLEKRFGLPRAIGFAILYSGGEWLRSLGDLSFPADLIAHGFGSVPAWLWVSSVTGPFGFTGFAIAVAVLADLAIEERARFARVAAALAALALWTLPPIVDAVARPRSEDGGELRIAIVQPVVAVEDKLTRERWPLLREKLEKLTLEAARGADLVVWPETARPGPLVWKDPAPFGDPDMEALATRASVPILYGCEIARVRDGRVRALYNGAALVRPGGGGDAWYGKQHLLPLVEGIPFASAFGWDPAAHAKGSGDRGSFLTLMGNFVPGPTPTIFEIGPARLGVLICYEGMYPSLARRYRRAGANALVVLTNDAWWGHSVFPAWHARMVAERARELDIPVIRAANSGISSVTDRFGRTGGATHLDETTILRQTVRLGSPRTTFYARHGDLPAAIVGLVLAVGIARFDALPGRGRSAVRGDRGRQAEFA